MAIQTLAMRTEDLKDHDQKTIEDTSPPPAIANDYDDLKPTLHWRTWYVLSKRLHVNIPIAQYSYRAVAVACGIILFGSN